MDLMNLEEEPDEVDDDRKPAALPRLDQCLVGLSPAYWAHVPLSIRQVHDLQLLQGINVLVQKRALSAETRLLPLSKCELLGIIVAVESRGDSVLYVLDDGTGLIDCLYWMNPDELLFSIVVVLYVSFE